MTAVIVTVVEGILTSLGCSKESIAAALPVIEQDVLAGKKLGEVVRDALHTIFPKA